MGGGRRGKGRRRKEGGEERKGGGERREKERGRKLERKLKQTLLGEVAGVSTILCFSCLQFVCRSVSLFVGLSVII